MAVSGCAEGPARDGNLVVTARVSGVVREARLVFSHPRDDTHACFLPPPELLAIATGAAPPAGAAAGQPIALQVLFGPDFPPPAPGAPVPNEAWKPYGPQAHFVLAAWFMPEPSSPGGPLRLRRSFRITVSAGDRLWERQVSADDPASEASVTIARDGLSGSFRVRGLVPQIPHGRMPESEAIAVEGHWRCPAD